MTMTRRIGVASLLVALVALGAPPVRAYLTFGTTVNNASVVTRWQALPISYYVTNRASATVTAAALQAAAAGGFDVWASATGGVVGARFAGFVGAEPIREDGATVIGLQRHEELERTLGVTSLTLDRTTGALVEADIFINSLFDWSTAPGGTAGRFDLASVVTHEIGHLLGLGHSALGETTVRPEGGRRVLGKRSVMFPVAFEAGSILDRQLQDDDVSGIRELYPDAAAGETGSVSGYVRINGAGVFGAHVVAVNTATGQTVGGFTVSSAGQFVITGLTPGLYVLRAEPLDDADLGGFFVDTSRIDVNFTPAFAPRLVSVPKGGAGASVEITVTRK